MAVLRVTTLDDELDSMSINDLVNNPNDLSLREALFIANNMAGADTITFATGSTITLTQGQLEIASDDFDATTGVLTFKNAPDFENPLDQGGDNSPWIGPWHWSWKGASERRC